LIDVNAAALRSLFVPFKTPFIALPVRLPHLRVPGSALRMPDAKLSAQQNPTAI